MIIRIDPNYTNPNRSLDLIRNGLPFLALDCAVMFESSLALQGQLVPQACNFVLRAERG